METIDGKKIPWGWNQIASNARWNPVKVLQAGSPFRSGAYGDAPTELLPRSIPLMERTYQGFASIRRSQGMSFTSHALGSPVTIPANATGAYRMCPGSYTAVQSLALTPERASVK